MVYYSLSGAGCGCLHEVVNSQLDGSLAKVRGCSPRDLICVIFTEEVAALVHQVEVIACPQSHEAEDKN